MHSIRNNLKGFPLKGDRLWILRKDEFKFGITDYNWELTGYDPKLKELYPEIFNYSTSAYYIINTFAKSNGYLVEEIEDRV